MTVPAAVPCAAGACRIDGPAGPLEAVIGCPRDGRMRAAGVICHPHPLYGGTLRNKVVHYLARTFNELGTGTVRFNFRGVGASAGEYDGGAGETEDLLAVLAWLRRRHPGLPLWLAGFSFGAWVALRAAPVAGLERLVTVAPPVHSFDFTKLPEPGCPWVLVQGDSDEVVPCAEVLRWAESRRPPPRILRLSGVDHFFHGRLNLLRERLLEALQG